MRAEVTWTCHVCGDTRPHRVIAVCRIEHDVGVMHYTENVRYCVDREHCAGRAGLGHAELARQRRDRPLHEPRPLWRRPAPVIGVVLPTVVLAALVLVG